MIHLTIPGEPVPQQRPRFTKYGHTYDPEKSKNYKAYVTSIARKEAPPEPLEGALWVVMLFFRSIPSSWSNKRQLQALNGEISPTTKPDNSNYLKGVEDALNGIIWKDDSQIVGGMQLKQYSDDPRVEVYVLGPESPEDVKKWGELVRMR